MKDDILGIVVEVEKEIAEKLKNEKAAAQERLEKLRKDSERELLREKEHLQAALDKAITDSRIAAENRASEILKDAHSLAERLEKISDDTLKKIIKKHIVRILP